MKAAGEGPPGLMMTLPSRQTLQAVLGTITLSKQLTSNHADTHCCKQRASMLLEGIKCFQSPHQPAAVVHHAKAKV